MCVAALDVDPDVAVGDAGKREALHLGPVRAVPHRRLMKERAETARVRRPGAWRAPLLPPCRQLQRQPTAQAAAQTVRVGSKRVQLPIPAQRFRKHDRRPRQRRRISARQTGPPERQSKEQLGQKHRARQIDGVGRHAFGREQQDVRIRARRQDLPDRPIDSLEHPQQRIAGGVARSPPQRMGLAQVPEVVPRGVRLAKDREEEIPLLAAQEIATDGGSSSDTGQQGLLEPREGDRIPVARVIAVERRMTPVGVVYLIEQIRRIGGAACPGGPRTPRLDLDAADVLGNAGLRHVEDRGAIIGAQRIKLTVFTKGVGARVAQFVRLRIERPAAPYPVCSASRPVRISVHTCSERYQSGPRSGHVAPCRCNDAMCGRCPCSTQRSSRSGGAESSPMTMSVFLMRERQRARELMPIAAAPMPAPAARG